MFLVCCQISNTANLIGMMSKSAVRETIKLIQSRDGLNTSILFLRQLFRIFALVLFSCSLCLMLLVLTHAQNTESIRVQTENTQGSAGEPYPHMPLIAPIGIRTGKYIDAPVSSQGPPIDPVKGYRIQDLGKGLYMITDNAYQSLFLVYDRGVVVVDAPPSLAKFIPSGIAEVGGKAITHIIYSHSHTDHIGGAKALGGHPVIIAHEETLRLLKRAADPTRPLPTVTFGDKHTLRVGNQVLELSYHGNAHEPGNIFISAPAQRVLMVVDIVFPGWMPWRRFALAQDVPGYFAQVNQIGRMDWDILIGGHVARTGTHADVATQAEFNRDVLESAKSALSTTELGVGLNPLDRPNPWAVFDNYIDRVAAQCVKTLAPKWSSRLAGFDVFIWDQCYAMEQSIRIE